MMMARLRRRWLWLENDRLLSFRERFCKLISGQKLLFASCQAVKSLNPTVSRGYSNYRDPYYKRNLLFNLKLRGMHSTQVNDSTTQPCTLQTKEWAWLVGLPSIRP